MGYTNSPLVAYTKLSPNHSGQRTRSIDRITPHCVVGQCSVETLGNIFYPTSRQASCNYGIGPDGRIGMYVEEKNRSWCSSSNANDQRAITIECSSDSTAPYAMTDAVYQSLIKLCTDICQRNGKTKLLWFADKDKTLNYSPASDEMVLSVHRWFANKSCPGDWLYNRLGDLATKVTEALGGSSTGTSPSGIQASVFANLTEKEAAAKIGELCKADMARTGILASVSAAQFILESGYGKSELAQNANNCFGMKCSLSGNTWSGSTWDGSSKYTKETKEEYTAGELTTITADFRKYASVEDSIADHSAYLLGAMNGSKKRYDGLKGCTDYKKAAQIIKDGGYATSSTYVDNLCSIIEKYSLTQYDTAATETKTVWYRVRKTWADSKSQLGAYKVLANAKACADKNPGYQHPDTGLIVIDTLQKVRSNDQNNSMYASDYKEISALKALADKYNVCILLIHHLRKQAADDPFQQIAGSNGLMGASDTSWVMQRKRMSQTASILVTGRDMDNKTLRLHEENCVWILDEEESTEQIVAKAVPSYLWKVADYIDSVGTWQGTATELLSAADVEGVLPHQLTRKIVEHFDTVFTPRGIRYETHRTSQARQMKFSHDGNDADDANDAEIDITQLFKWDISQTASSASLASQRSRKESKHGRSVATGQPAEKPTGTAPNPCEAAGA